MCGISGQINRSGVVDRRLFQRFVERLSHRGRDYLGTYYNDNVALGHNRLSIIDISAASNQPMLSSDGSLILVFNGEIFNYKDLRQKLETFGVSFFTQSDTEVLLKALDYWGMDIVSQLEGMFAFCLYNVKTSKLYLCRDRLGIKPLYFYNDGETFLFASEAKAIACHPNVSVTIDPEGLVDYLATQLYLDQHTLFKGIYSLEPGKILEVSGRGLKVSERLYWELPSHNIKISYSEAAEELRRLLRIAVGKWCASDVPIGAFVSGGIDSSGVASLAQERLSLNSSGQKLLCTFSSIFDDPYTQDERQFSSAVASYLKSDHHAIVLDREQLIHAHEDLIYDLDMPIAGWAAPGRVFSKYVKNYVDVVLAGHGGDELFAGYPKYSAAVLAHHINMEYSGKHSSLPTGLARSFIGFEKQALNILHSSLFGSDEHIVKSFFDRGAYLLKFLSEDLKKASSNYDPFAKLYQRFEERQGSFLKRLLYLDVKTLLPALLHVEDRVTMASTLESRPPLLDNSIVDFAATLPDEVILGNGLKGVLREAFRPILPRDVIENRRKSGTIYPAKVLFDNELSAKVQEGVGFLDKAGIFNISGVELLNQQEQLINQRVTWGLWSLGSWCHSFL